MAEKIQVKDFAGRDVVLSTPAKRIIALAPHIVENLFSAGAGGAVVGVVDYCDFPAEAKEIENVGAISAFSLEKIIALKPDLVIVWYSGNGAKYIDKLTALGIPAYASNPKTLEDIAKSIRDYGALAGTGLKADEVAGKFVTDLSSLQRNNQNKSTVSVFYQVWNDPLQTLNGDQIISDVIRMCGGRNIFADEISVAPKVSLESVIAYDPEAIVASGMGEEKPEWLDDWRRFTSLTAVKRNNLFFIHPDLIQRHTIRILSGADSMCRHLDAARKHREK